MPSSTWPTSLPELPLHNGYSMSRQSGVTQDDGSTGKINRRRRFTATSNYHTVSMVLDKEELLIFFSFFDLSIGHGTLNFTYTNPIFQGGDITCRIQNNEPPYTISYDKKSLDYLVQFTLEELPGTVRVAKFDKFKVTTDESIKQSSSPTIDEFKITEQ